MTAGYAPSAVKKTNSMLISFQYMTDVAVLLGADRERATEELWLCIEFETKLANVSLNPVYKNLDL